VGQPMVNWIYFPKSDKPSATVTAVVSIFEEAASRIDSDSHQLSSNEVLAEVATGLEKIGFRVETGKKATEKIRVPVLFGMNGKLEKAFEADGYHEQERFVLEVEAGRGVTNNQFLKDLFQACMMQDVDFLAIAVRNIYRTNSDFEIVVRFFNTLYVSSRLTLPLKGILLIGY